jgi:hypothetical protein
LTLLKINHMKNLKMQELSDEELLKKKESLKSLIYSLAGFLIGVLFVTTISTITHYFFPLGHNHTLLATLLFNIKNMKEIKKELESRG